MHGAIAMQQVQKDTFVSLGTSLFYVIVAACVVSLLVLVPILSLFDHIKDFNHIIMSARSNTGTRHWQGSTAQNFWRVSPTT